MSVNYQGDARPAAPTGSDHKAFPELTDAQMQRLSKFGEVVELNEGDKVFFRGQRVADFYVLIDGCIEIFDYDCEGHIQVFTVHCKNQFTGEIDLFSNRKVLVGGRAGAKTKARKLNREQFREMLTAESEIGEIIIRAFITRRLGILEQNLGGSLLIGHRNDPLTLRIRSFLSSNGYPCRTLFTGEDEDAGKIANKYNCSADDMPLFLCHGEDPLKQPTEVQVAETVGILEQPSHEDIYDLAVIGGGPGGLAAAVYGASEGLTTVVLERRSPGGQASTSSKIENYLGFPTGLSGNELAGRAQIQAQKFGATLALPMQVNKIEGTEPPYTIQLDACDPIQAKSIVIASGATYRKLDLPNDDDFEGRGLHYAATAVEASLCQGEPVIVVGGGNSAGQAAVYLSGRTEHVHMLIRGDSLASSMSEYLIRRINAVENITLHRQTEICELSGDDHLKTVTWKNKQTGETSNHEIGHVFLMIGAKPNTEFLRDCLATDPKGFVCTGDGALETGQWPLERPPTIFETSLPNVYAIGDVRSGSVKRVASAVGEGSICIQFVHQAIADK